jgi:hypothetical protein
MSRIDTLVTQYGASLAQTNQLRKRLEKAVLTSIRAGAFDNSHTNMILVNMLSSLRRRGVIENLGSRKNPIWTIKTKV